MGRYHRFRYARLHQIEVFDRVDKCSLIVNNETWDSFLKIMHENEGKSYNYTDGKEIAQYQSKCCHRGWIINDRRP